MASAEVLRVLEGPIGTARERSEELREAARSISQSATDALAWSVLKRWERDGEFNSFRFECDTYHACQNTPDHIVCFNKALGFFGCVDCGRVHRCAADWNTCIMALDVTGAYTCVFSGRHIAYDTAAGTFSEEVRIGSLSHKDSVNRTRDTLESMQLPRGELGTALEYSKQWERQRTRQKRWREEEEGEDAEGSDESSAEKRPRIDIDAAADDDSKSEEAPGEAEGDADSDHEREWTNYGTETHAMDYDEFFATPPEKPRKRGGDGGGEASDAEGGPGPGDEAGDGFGGGGGGSGDSGDRVSRFTTTDVYKSGTQVGQWQRNTAQLMTRAHNLTHMDTTVVPPSFLAAVPLELNRYRAVEAALRAFDAEYAAELSDVAQTFTTEPLSPPADERSQTSADSLTASAPATPTPATSYTETMPTASMIGTLTRQRAYDRTMKRVRRGVEQDVRAVLHALVGQRTDKEMDYINFSLRLLRILMRETPRHMPVHLQRIGLVVMLDLLVSSFVVYDNVNYAGDRKYNHIVWNADEALAAWSTAGLVELMFVEETRRTKPKKPLTGPGRVVPTRAQLERIRAFREQYNIKRAQFAKWTSETRRLLGRITAASAPAFHAALFSCPLT